jgi:hypothetical protein
MTTLSSSKAVDGRDPLFFVWAAVATFIATSIAVRSWFLGDRVVIGVAAGAFVISVVRRLVSPSPSIDLVLGGLDSLAWASAAVTCLVLLFSGWRKRTAWDWTLDWGRASRSRPLWIVAPTVASRAATTIGAVVTRRGRGRGRASC